MPDQRDTADALTATWSATGQPPTGLGDMSPPRVLGNRYLLEELIAHGGMASVWRAHDEKLARTVAVKLLHRHLSDAEDYRERFRREAISAAKLSHPGIVNVYDTGADAGWVYLVMEYVEGSTLAEVLADQAPLDTGQVALLGEQVATALHVANRLGVVHRDVKPANILIDTSGTAKVTDFGIAKAEDAVSDLTSTGMVLGTAAYLAPEQIRAVGLDHRADQYSLGCVLYEALTGRKPFTADSSMEVATQRLNADPLDIRSIRTGVPRGLADVVMRALQREPKERWPDNGAFADALRAYAVDQALPTTELEVGDSRTASGGRSFMRSEGRWLSVVLALVVAVGVLVGIGLATGVLEASGIPSLSAFEIGGDGDEGPQDAVSAQAVVPDAGQLSIFDPAGDGENGDLLPAAVDADPSTAWQTETYRNRADFGGLKDGVGVVIDLGSVRTITGVEITTPTPGITVQLRAADEPATQLSDWAALTEPTTIDDASTIQADPVDTRFLMVWITGDLASVGDGRWRAAIAELAVLEQSA